MILVAIGANLRDAAGRPPLETCRWAAARLARLPICCGTGLRLVGLSRWYRTAPVPASEQPDYINGVARLAGDAAPHAMLAALHGIETVAGRVRGAPNAARTLDLDLLAIDGLVVAEPGLQLPHPRMQDRAFVLAPLRDVAPGWRHPVLGRTAGQLLAAVGAGNVRALAA